MHLTLLRLSLPTTGGLAIEAIRSLVISQQLLGTREVYVVHHTDCGKACAGSMRHRCPPLLTPSTGMLTFKDSDLAKIIKENLGVKGTPIIGLRYDCTDGALHEVAKAERV